jgi:hypothetical protein
VIRSAERFSPAHPRIDVRPPAQGVAELVNLINAHGPYAVGITGEDAHLFTAVRRSVTVDGVATDRFLDGDFDASALQAHLTRRGSASPWTLLSRCCFLGAAPPRPR